MATLDSSRHGSSVHNRSGSRRLSLRGALYEDIREAIKNMLMQFSPSLSAQRKRLSRGETEEPYKVVELMDDDTYQALAGKLKKFLIDDFNGTAISLGEFREPISLGVFRERIKFANDIFLSSGELGKSLPYLTESQNTKESYDRIVSEMIGSLSGHSLVRIGNLDRLNEKVINMLFCSYFDALPKQSIDNIKDFVSNPAKKKEVDVIKSGLSDILYAATIRHNANGEPYKILDRIFGKTQLDLPDSEKHEHRFNQLQNAVRERMNIGFNISRSPTLSQGV